MSANYVSLSEIFSLHFLLNNELQYSTMHFIYIHDSYLYS